MYVIGTAGHVDHGKSTLIKVLTGIDPDRLKEEQERQMTIDLGFAWFTLPGGEEVGIVDVPGHRDFIKNMLAGVGGIDAVLFVVAADEGVMPQTKEHLAILDLLDVKNGVVVLSKIDLVKDPEWLELVEIGIRNQLSKTGLSQAPIIRVSALNGEGLEDLKIALGRCLKLVSPRRDLGKPRLPIDRVFTIKGFGTVVTGTLMDGKLRVGDEVQVLPTGVKGRIRGLQTHKKKEKIAIPGSRTAVNISGIEANQLRRGNVLTYPGLFQTTSRFDAKLRLLSDIHSRVKHNDKVKLFIGAAEYLARVRVLEKESIQPGDNCFVQIEFNEPAVMVRGDHFVIRRPSPPETLGGGVVLSPYPSKRCKRFSKKIINHLQLLASGSLEKILLEIANNIGIMEIKDIFTKLAVSETEFLSIFKILISNQQVILLEKGEIKSEGRVLFTTESYLQKTAIRVLKEVNDFQACYPLRRGIQKADLKSRLKIQARVFQALMDYFLSANILKEKGNILFTPDHAIVFTKKEQKLIEELYAEFDRQPYAPPTKAACINITGEELYFALIELGELVPVSNDIAFRKKTYDDVVQSLIMHLKTNGIISLAEFRDKFHTSRRYALTFLEHIDSLGITVREGDVRRLKKERDRLK